MRPRSLAVHLGETFGTGHADEAALDVVHPAVEGAGEAAHPVATARVDDADAAVLAHVEHGPHPPVGVTGEQYRCARRVEGHPRAGRRQVAAQAREHRVAVEDLKPFLFELLP